MKILVGKQSSIDIDDKIEFRWLFLEFSVEV